MECEKYKVIISEKAKNMLASNIAFIAKVSADAATKQKKAVIDGIRSLEQMPKRYPFFNEEYIPPNKYRKMFIKTLETGAVVCLVSRVFKIKCLKHMPFCLIITGKDPEGYMISGLFF